MSYQEKLTKWDLSFLSQAKFIAGRSKDPSTKCGAVISDDRFRPVSQGYNGFPQGIDDSPERYADRELKLKLVLHAEQNALAFATGRDLRDCTIYVWPMPPCIKCAMEIIQYGIKRVVSVDMDDETYARWGEGAEEAAMYLREAGVDVSIYDRGDVS